MDWDDIWYKNAVFYAGNIDRFRDGDGDGTGDIVGLIDRLDYVRWLGDRKSVV